MTNPLSHHLLLQHVLTHSPYVTLYWKILYQELKIWAFFFFYKYIKSDGWLEGNQMKETLCELLAFCNFCPYRFAHYLHLSNMCFWQNLLHYNNNKSRGRENSCNLLFYIYKKCQLLIKVLPSGFLTAKV